jgi:deoxycytidylate deaminase
MDSDQHWGSIQRVLLRLAIIWLAGPTCKDEGTMTGDVAPTPTEPVREARHAPEVVIAFVAPTGTDRDLVLTTADQLLRGFRYESRVVRLSTVLERLGTAGVGSDEITRVRTWRLQDEGNRLCAKAGRADALAFVAVTEIQNARKLVHRDRGEPETTTAVAPETAYFVWSLKRPREVDTLRAIYRSRFFLISVHTPYIERLERLTQDEADRGTIAGDPTHEDRARELIERDEREPLEPEDRQGVSQQREFGQNVSDTFPMADFFVDATTFETARNTLHRALDVTFGNPFVTPTRNEFGMYLADGAALKSAELGRQVGAAIVTRDGDVVATGTNEVPKPTGGHYWIGDEHDDREFVRGADTSDRLRGRLINEVVEAVEAVVGDDSGKRDPGPLIKVLRDTRLSSIIEFGRAVHAEMAALVDAARRGVPVRNCVLYVTTFPCHICTRMIIAAGIDRVEYIYPYPKSLSDELYRRQIDTGRGISLDTNPIPFVPFIGVAPRRYRQAFNTPPAFRKGKRGEAVRLQERSPRLLIEDPNGEWDLSTHLHRENAALDRATWLDEQETKGGAAR